MRYTGILEIILTIASSTPRNMPVFECVDQPEASQRTSTLDGRTS
jgi:hypothetical protein